MTKTVDDVQVIYRFRSDDVTAAAARAPMSWDFVKTGAPQVGDLVQIDKLPDMKIVSRRWTTTADSVTLEVFIG